MKRKYFLDAVRIQMKSEKAKEYIAKELDHHIVSEKTYWLKKGLTDNEAEAKAVQQMGSPLLLGQQLNKIHRPKVDWWLLVIVSIIISIGFLPILEESFQTDAFTMLKKIIITVIGLCLIIGFMFLDYTKLRKYSWLFYSSGLFIQLCLLLFANFTINGSPYIILGPLSIEDTICIPLFWIGLAGLLSKGELKARNVVILFVIPYLLFLLANKGPNAMVFLVIVIVMVWFSVKNQRKRLKIILPMSGVVLTALLYIWRNMEYIQNRFNGFLKPESFDSGYFYLIIKEQLPHVKWIGKSDMSLTLTEQHTDFAFIHLLSQYGWLFTGFLVLILLFLLIRLIAISKVMKDLFGKILTIGGIALFTTQLAYSIGMNLGYLPLTGMPLPFISYGLMPILIHAIVIGVVLSAYRQKDLLINIHS